MPVTRPFLQETPTQPHGEGSEGSQVASTVSPLLKEACECQESQCRDTEKR